MSNQMSNIDGYISELKKNIFTSDDRKAQFEADLRSHIEEKIDAGQSEFNALRKMGNPEEVAHEFMAETGIKYANIFERFLAFMVDLSVCTIVAGLFFLLLYIFPKSIITTIYPDLPADLPQNLEGLIQSGIEVVFLVVLFGLFFVGFSALVLLYFPLMETLYGWTLGKKLLKLRVIKEDLRRVNFGAAILRRLSLYFELLFLDAIFIPFTEKRQRAFDIIAKTIVIREESGNLNWVTVGIILAVIVMPFLMYFGLIESHLLNLNTQFHNFGCPM